MKRVLEYAGIAVVAVLVALAVQAWLIKPYRIPSESMLDTLRPGDRVLVNRFVYHLREPERGDVVVFRVSQGPGRGVHQARHRRPRETSSRSATAACTSTAAW